MEPDKILIEVKNQLEELDKLKNGLIAENVFLKQNYEQRIKDNRKKLEVIGNERTEIINEFMDVYNKSLL